MKAIRIQAFGGPEVLQLDDVAIPQPAEGELLVRIHAASVNPVDYKIRRGTVPWVSSEMLPMTLGRDLSGTVESAGTGVDAFSDGDALYAMLGGIDRGSYAEYVLVRPNEAAPKPARLSHIEAAAVPLAALTAWQGLFDHGYLEAGQTVLIHGGSGGVGHFAIQFAKVKGAEVLTTVSAQNLDFVEELGADRAIDHQSQRFEEIARDVDLVLDLVGGETRERSWSVLKPGGVLVSALGEPSREKAMQHRAHGVGYRAQPNAGQLAEIGRLIDEGKVRPVIMATYQLAEARGAHERLERGHVRGKIVLVVTE
ncbi:MAG TPA: NADP-dependent oxidoreductase [Stellaceae bacterium]|jgi:NADPH:quinone reductase-like Zn-dependent oxidoreductase|nr:NADP-dependent oxidoreductase [Stellaceae bacterium]